MEGSDEAFQQAPGVRGQQCFRQLASKSLQPKLDCKDVDGEDSNSQALLSFGAQMLVDGTGWQDKAKKSQAEGCREETEKEKATETEPFQEVTHGHVGNCSNAVDQYCKIVSRVVLLIRSLDAFISIRRQNLEEELLGEGEAREVLETGDSEDQQ